MARAKLTARTFPTNRRSAAGPWASRRERSLVKQREEQVRCCSLIYKVARFMAVRRRRPLFLPPHPRRNQIIPASEWACSTPQPRRGFACARRLRIRAPILPFQPEPAGAGLPVGRENKVSRDARRVGSSFFLSNRSPLALGLRLVRNKGLLHSAAAQRLRLCAPASYPRPHSSFPTGAR